MIELLRKITPQFLRKIYSDQKKRNLINKENYYLQNLSSEEIGTVAWLIGTEIKYGGVEYKVSRHKFSPHEEIDKIEQIKEGYHRGGDRMMRQDYANDYAKFLAPFLKKHDNIYLVEFGILKGTGLAIWCDFFPEGNILGFDIYLDNFHENLDNLKSLGAFSKNMPEVYEYDQFLINIEYLGKIFSDNKINIVIDDGYHSVETIMNTIESVKPYLDEDYIYIIEDHKTVHNDISAKYSCFEIYHNGPLTVLSPIT